MMCVMMWSMVACCSARIPHDPSLAGLVMRLTCGSAGGRNRDRTCDRLLVRQVLYR
jgi:hypothetical protein